MPLGESVHGNNSEMEGQSMQLQVIQANLGENNIGPFGPSDIDDTKKAEIHAANANPEYRRPATNRYQCVDGRCTAEEMASADIDQAEYDPQMPGGQAVLESMTDYMLNVAPQPLSATVAAKTEAAIADGFQVIAHGANGNKAGCKANEDGRLVLNENAANVDIVVPIADSVNTGLGIASQVPVEQVTAMVVAGKEAADNEDLWDVSAAEVVDIVVAHGGEYMDYVGDHHEKSIRGDLTPGAVRRAKLTNDLSSQEQVVQQFIASLGQYKADTFARYARHGKTETEAALQVAAAVLYTIGISKHLSSREMTVDLIATEV